MAKARLLCFNKDAAQKDKNLRINALIYFVFNNDETETRAKKHFRNSRENVYYQWPCPYILHVFYNLRKRSGKFHC